MSIFNHIIKSAFAADVPAGNIKGIGLFGFEKFLKISPTASSDELKAEAGTQFGKFLSTIIATLTVVGGLAFVIFFTMGGLKWITAGGDKTKVQEAQTQMTQGVIGLVAIVAGVFVVGVVGGILGIDFLNPFKTLFGT